MLKSDAINKFIEYLNAEKKDCLAKAGELENDTRRDEAIMAKIRANVYGIFVAVTQTSEKGDPDNPVGFIREKFESIPEAWKESLAEAERHNDYVKTMNERVKLETLAAISEKFENILRASEA